MRQSERRPRSDRCHDPIVILGLSCVRDQQKDEVGFGGDRVHLACGPVGSRKAGLLGGGERARASAQPHFYADAAAGERFPQVLRLSRTLRRPADDANLTDPRERFGQQREKMAPASNDPFFGAAQGDLFHRENIGAERHIAPRGRLWHPVPIIGR